MNFYGETNGPEHQLFGRIAPICDALHRALNRATGRPVPASTLSNAMPEWCHNIADRLVLTVLKPIASLAPHGQFDARGYGRMVGLFLRAVTFFFNEVPAELKRDGLLDLNPEQEKKVDSMIDMPAILAFASTKFGQSVSNDEELIEVGTENVKKTVEVQVATLFSVLGYLIDRPISEQHEFLCGIPEGFIFYLNKDGGYAGRRPRTELYLLLLMYWPEIAEMQKSEPPKTSKFLLEWLEKQEGKQMVEDEKQFYGLCGEIGLVMAPPGHPRKSPPA